MSATPEAHAPVITRQRLPKPWWRWTAVVLGLAGWWLSLQLLLAGAGGSAAGGVLEVLCGRDTSADQRFDCRSVLASRWGSIPLTGEEGGATLPVAAVGMAYFAFVTLWYLFVGPPTRPRRAYHLIPLLVVVGGVLVSADFVRVMALELRQWCVGCLLAHVANAGLLLCTLAAWPWRARTMQHVPCPHPTARLVLATLTAGTLAALLHLTIVFIASTGGQVQRLRDAYLKIVEDPEYVLWDYRRQPVVEIPVRPDALVRGAPEAPNRVVVFSDFQCPQCRKLHGLLEELLRTYPDRVRIEYRHFPQDPACNPRPEFGAGHPAACQAARACEAARVAGGPEAAAAMYRLLYQRQAELDRQRFVEWAGELGLNRAAFESAINSPDVAAQVAEDIACGARLGVAAVPVVYLNGRRLERWGRISTWAALLSDAATVDRSLAP